ncbi:MAG: Rpn family recombination-promoting nuclease/putative transposase [Myxococcota bacterium]
MMLGCYLDPKNDYAFRRIFGDEKREHVLRRFLNSVLRLQGHEQIKHLRIADPHQLPAIEGWKENVLDIRCWDQNEHNFLVEMQVWDQKDFQYRALYAAAKAYVDQLQAGEQYKHLRKVTLLSILGFCFLETPNYLANHLILDAETGEHRLKGVDFTFLELPKFTKNEEELETIEDKWAYFLKNAHKTPLHKFPAALHEPEIEEAFEVLETIGRSATEKQLYDAAHMMRMDHVSQIETGYEKGLEKGLEKGRKQEKLHIARTMRSSGMNEQVIIQITGLTREELETLD